MRRRLAAALHEVQKYPADYNGIVVGGDAAHLRRPDLRTGLAVDGDASERRRRAPPVASCRSFTRRSWRNAIGWTA